MYWCFLPLSVPWLRLCIFIDVFSYDINVWIHMHTQICAFMSNDNVYMYWCFLPLSVPWLRLWCAQRKKERRKNICSMCVNIYIHIEMRSWCHIQMCIYLFPTTMCTVTSSLVCGCVCAYTCGRYTNLYDYTNLYVYMWQIDKFYMYIMW